MTTGERKTPVVVTEAMVNKCQEEWLAHGRKEMPMDYCRFTLHWFAAELNGEHTMPPMTTVQRGIVHHALGLKDKNEGFRNYYVSSATPVLEEMRKNGWLKRYDPTEWLPDYTYVVTQRGLEAAGLSLANVDHEVAKRLPE